MRVATMLLCLCLVCCLTGTSLADGALQVNGKTLSAGECNAWMWLVKQSYGETVDYYERTLGIDYWYLTYANGQSVWDSVKADAFKQLVMMRLFCDIAEEEGLSLSAEETRLCREAAGSAPSDQGFSEEELETILKTRLLADKAYSYRLSFVDIDRESIASSVDRDSYMAYELEYLYVPLYVYGENAAKREEYLEMLAHLQDFRGDYEDAARLSVFLVSGKMTLCPADCESDSALLEAARRLQVGENSQPIKTDYGLFMIRLLNDCDASLYEAEVDRRINEALQEGYRNEYRRLYAEAKYSLDAGYWDTLKP